MTKPLIEFEPALPAVDDIASLMADHPAIDPTLKPLIERSKTAHNLIAHIFQGSSFLTDTVRRYPDFTVSALTASPDEVMAGICNELADQVSVEKSQQDVMALLRHARNKAALLIALCDIASAWSCDKVTANLTRFADTAVAVSVRWLCEQAVVSGQLVTADKADPTKGYTVLAMGKHGAGELNYSSDIDLIVFYDPDIAPLADPASAAQVYVRLTRSLVALLQERTVDGYVFRVDLRLRPDPRATQVAIAIAAAQNYYESMGQNWERAAMIKARPIAGDLELGAEFLSHLVPFVWRKYLDFAAIADVQSLKRQMHAHKGHGSVTVLGHNIKLGRGGIREIEFFVQTQQLIAGGRNKDLRKPSTREMLKELVAAGWLEEKARKELDKAYEFLRTIEHRLQMVADEQTQTLPATEEAFAGFARFCGYENPDSLSEKLLQTFTIVQGHYTQLFENEPELDDDEGSLVFTGGEDDPETLETLGRLGFARSSDVSATIRGWHFGRYPAMRSAAARERLTELMPVLLAALAKTGQPDQAFIAFDRFMAGLPAGVQLFSMFKANPFLLELVAMVLGTAPRLANSLALKPRQLEAVLDPSFFEALPQLDELTTGFDAIRDGQQDYEDILDATRVEAREKALRIGIRIMSETVSAAQAGQAYSNLADAVITHLLTATHQELTRLHGAITDGSIAVIAMGKLGGMEMTATSDLDLMMLYDFAETADGSDGPKSLMPSQYYSRLTQRFITALTSQTSQGDLYEVDMRLRPSGNKGPVATHINGFEKYHAGEAWTWEKMALTRARVVAGDAHIVQSANTIIRNILTTPRDKGQTLEDVRHMRARILQEAGKSDVWDIKQVRGGLVEVEFIAQGLQLVHVSEAPDILQTNTLSALTALHEADYLQSADYDHLTTAAELYGSVLQVLRLCSSEQFNGEKAPEGLKNLLLRTTSMPDLATLEAALRDANAQVSGIFDRIIGDPAS